MIGRLIPWAIGIVLTGLYAFALVRPIGDIIGLPQFGLEIAPTGWAWLIGSAALPIVAYALALWAGRGRNAAVRLTAFATGLVVVAAIQLELQLLVPLSSFFV